MSGTVEGAGAAAGEDEPGRAGRRMGSSFGAAAAGAGFSLRFTRSTTTYRYFSTVDSVANMGSYLEYKCGVRWNASRSTSLAVSQVRGDN